METSGVNTSPSATSKIPADHGSPSPRRTSTRSPLSMKNNS